MRSVVQQYQVLAQSLQSQKDTMEQMIQNFDKAQKAYNTTVNHQVKRFNKILDEELGKSLKNVGNQQIFDFDGNQRLL